MVAKIEMVREQRKIEKLLATAKSRNLYDPKAFDNQVVAVLTKLAKDAKAINDQFIGTVDVSFNGARAAMDALEKLAKKGKKLTPADIQTMEGHRRTIQHCVSDATDANDKIFPLTNEFRGAWQDAWEALVSDPRLVAAAVDVRTRTIDDAKPRTALITRMEQYFNRAETLLKTAKTQAGQLADAEQSHIDTFNDAVKKLGDAMKDPANPKAGLLRKLDTITKLDPKKKPDADMMRFANSLLIEIQGQTKTYRGHLKSLDIQMAAFKKLAATFGGADKQRAAKAYADAAKLAKEYAAADKKISVQEAKAVKIMTAVKKLK